MRSLPVLILFVLMLAAPAAAQKIIRGRVTDAETGQGLPAAHVAVIGRRTGTITNDEGRYQFELPVLPLRIRFSSIGYHSREVEITAGSPDSLDIPLARNPVVLDEIVVTDEDPAERIMREVIRRKQVWRAELEKYSATGYARVTLGNGKKTVMKLETVLDVFWDRNKGFTTSPKAKRRTGARGSGEGVSLSNLNLYDDYITVFDQRIFGITHPGALRQYSFRLTGRRMIDDRTVFVISVVPKNRYEKLLAGEVSVLDGEFAIIEAKLHPTTALKIPLGREGVAALRKAFLPPPKLDMEIALEQRFDNYGGGYWLPIGEKFTGKLDVGWKGLLAFPPIEWEETARFTDFTVTAAPVAESVAPAPPPEKKPAGVHVEAEDGTFSIGISAPSSGNVPESGAAEPDTTAGMALDEADSTIIRDSDFIPPVVTVYSGSDSTTVMNGSGDLSAENSLTIFEAFRPTGVFGNIIARKAEKEMKKEVRKEKEAGEKAKEPDLADSGKAATGKRKARGILGWSVLPHWSYNRVDGNNAGLKLKSTMMKKYTAELLGVWQTERGRFAWDGGIVVPFDGKASGASMEFRAMDRTLPVSVSPVYTPFVNSILTLLGNDDYFDYCRTIGQSATARFSMPKRKLEFSAGITREKHRSLRRETNYNLFGRSSVQRENPPVDEGRLGAVTFTAGYGDAVTPYLLGGQRRIDVFFEYADHGLFSGDFVFRKFRAVADWRFLTFFRDGLEPNTLDVRILGMVSEGDLPVQRFGRIDSGSIPFAPYGTFRARCRPLAGEQLFAVFWEHNFRTVPFEIVRLNFLARRGTEIILQGASGRAWVSGDRRTVLPGEYSGRFHHELGLTVNNIYAGTMVSVTKDLNARSATVGIGYKRPF